MKSIKKLFITLLSIITVLSCQVGLGEAVDTIGPIITITSPEPNQSVQSSITVSGIAQDNIEINEILIEIEHQEGKVDTLKYKIKDLQLYWWDGTNWQLQQSHNISGTKTQVNWSIDAILKQGNEGSGDDYDISVTVSDMFGNESKKSKDTRTVTVDFNEPKVAVNIPSLIGTNKAAETTSSSFELRNSSILSQLYNGKFIMSGTQEEDGTCDHINIFIDSETSETDISMYENKTMEEITSNSKLLSYKIVDDKNQRIWEKEFDVNTFPEEYRTGKHIVRVVTQSYDSAQNCETKIQGFFIIWNDADKPWVVADFGSKTKEEYVDVQPSCELYGQAYDDDGLAEITINVYKEVDDGWAKLETNSKVIDLSEKSYPTYYLWTVKSLSENVNFKAEVKCKDKYWSENMSDDEKKFHESETVYQYMKVMDTNPPSLNISQAIDTLPMTGTKTYTLSGTVEDDGEIADYIKIVRIADNKDNTQVKYFSKDFKDWDDATEDGYTVLSPEETAGNKLWKIYLGKEEVNGRKHKRTFSKIFNISDFGIDGTNQLFGTQKFIVYTSDTAGSATIELFTIAGDSEKPEIKIKSIKVNNNDPIDLTGGNKTLEPFNSLDKVVLSGTWEDNSDVLKASNINLSWEGITGDFGIKVNYNPDKKSGTWHTKELTPPAATTAVIYAEITDWAKNIGKDNTSFYVSSSLPKFERISADTPDGSYKEGKVIEIYMEFNKNVKFTGGTPSLQLNTNKPATYSSGDGTAKHIFTYTVAAGDNTDCLEVSGINKDGITWQDVEVETAKIETDDMVLPTGNTLKSNRTIIIDTASPKIGSIKFSTADGYYSKGSEIFVTLKFNEEVKIENIDDLKIKFNSGENIKSDSVTKSGADSVLFKYKVDDGQNALTGLSVTGIEFGSCIVTDIAGNKMKDSDKTISAVNAPKIIVDTTKPNKPVITGVSNNSIIYSEDGATFDITWAEEKGTKKYSLDGGKSVVDYTGPVTLKNKGTYEITAYQEDEAGNKSDNAEPITITLDRGTVITSLTADKPDGTYKTDQKIQIIVNYRKNVIVSSDSYLTLNTNPAQKAMYKSGSGSKKIYFEYEIKDGDSCSTAPLQPQEFIGTITDEKGNDLKDYTKLASVISPNKFTDNKEIYVITQAPKVNSAVFNDDGTKCTITFSSKINKNYGNITFTQSSNGYRAPVVLTEAKYNSLKDATKEYYEEGTNGANASGVSDLTKKYILKYEYEDTNSGLVSQFTSTEQENALVLNVPLYSKVVTIKDNVMEIDISSAYKLPVKGAIYTITIPAALINDDISQTNAEASFEQTLPGCEEPVIRINKSKETISGTIVTQPLTVNVKMSCQTPGSEVYYVDGSKRYQEKNVITYLDKGYDNSGMPAQPADPSAEGTKYVSQITGVGSKVIENGKEVTVGNKEGVKVFYRAKGKVTSGSKTWWSNDYYETAYKTVITATFEPGDQYSYLWLRGGDSVNGGVSTPKFPFSWNTSEYSNVRAMTKIGNKDWYWVTWNISTTAYIGFLSGDMPGDASTNGPKNWCWATQAFVGYKANTPIYPGESFQFNDIDRSGTIAFQGKHKESR